MYIIDDLTAKDRIEKRKWQKEVQLAYQAGRNRYHFAAGKWRDNRGNLAAFYNERATPTASVAEASAHNAPVLSTQNVIQDGVTRSASSNPNFVDQASSRVRTVTADIHHAEAIDSSE